MLAVQRQAVGGPARVGRQADAGRGGPDAVVPDEEAGEGVVEGVPVRGGRVRAPLVRLVVVECENFSCVIIVFTEKCLLLSSMCF